MTNLVDALRNEIRTAAREHSKAALLPIRAEMEAIRKSLVTIERRLAKNVAASNGAPRVTTALARAAEGRRARFSSALMRKHREALLMSRKAYAKLLGVSGLSVYLWESGRTRPRRGTIFAWQDLRKKGARELRALAGVITPKKVKPSKPKTRVAGIRSKARRPASKVKRRARRTSRAKATARRG